MKNKYVILFLITALMITFYGTIDIASEQFCDNPDIANYRMMAHASPGFDVNVSRNFGYRILMPYLVGLMPVDIDTGFRIFSVMFSFLLVFIFFRFLIEYGLKEDTSFFLTVLFIINKYTFGFPVWNPYDLHDLLTHILILLFLLSLKKNNFILMGSYLFIGVINRETLLFIVPAALIYYFSVKHDKSSAIKLALYTAPAVIMLLIIRSFLITESAAETGIIYSLSKLRFDESNKIFSPVTYYRIANTFIPLTLIPFIYLKITKKFFRENIHFLVFTVIYISSSFLAGDTERLIVPVFPVFFLLLGIIFEKIRLNSFRDRLIVLLISVFSIPHHIYFRFTVPHRNIKVIISLITLFVLTGYFIYLKNKRKNDALDNNSDIQQA